MPDNDDTARIGHALRSAREYLAGHPDEAAYTDSPATARVESGLRVVATGPDGARVMTDMPPSVGGGGSAPSAGWLLRAGHAACVATLIAMRAGEEGVAVAQLEVTVDSYSDDRGITGADETVTAGPIRTRVHVRIGADGVARETLGAIVDWGVRHCPVDDAVRRAVPITVQLEMA